MRLAPRWRVLDSGAADGITNMATDHALLARAATSGEGVLRVYAWSRPTLSLGLHERTRITPVALDAHGVDIVRRPTGGRALLHHREVTYSVTAPLTGVGLGESYHDINALLIAALQRLGVNATEAPRRDRPVPPDGAPCFAEPNVGELVVDGRKLVGSAQRRDEHALLQHGSILLEDDQARIAALSGEVASANITAATLRGVTGRPVVYGDMRDALIATLRDRLGGAPLTPLDPAPLEASIAQYRVLYSDPTWTWSRVAPLSLERS